ncbi:hypothetical protein [Wenxinia marina]|uniref:Uncharacterized protein n=1 Tax=Wenxinia marina DSM 24838 TaxID=1123501 RepID=A0A0D0Q4M4_9RHOB|nr:hypothetical protein [Wenxinia marina]KIQ67507.1 hypothetical protein Wenmar_03932 [Wenxinia marina DSM 24838]GGL68941.1 hypothetical protein GCM10011392_24270 [Wenxinia marina]
MIISLHRHRHPDERLLAVARRLATRRPVNDPQTRIRRFHMVVAALLERDPMRFGDLVDIVEDAFAMFLETDPDFADALRSVMIAQLYTTEAEPHQHDGLIQHARRRG